MRDRTDRTGVAPEAVGQTRPEQGESKTGGLPTFIGINLVVWSLVVVLAVVFIGVIIWYATNN